MVKKEKEKPAPPPDELRCNRTDGRQWRCTRWSLEGKKLCEIHYLQGRHRQCKRKVPDSLKLERTRIKFKNHKNKGVKINGGSSSSKTSKMPLVEKRRQCAAEALDEALKKMKLKRGDLQLELLRVFLKRRVEKKKEKEVLENEEEIKNDEANDSQELELPNALVEISMANLVNVGTELDVKVGSGVNGSSGTMIQRDFRSKNIEVVPISTMQVAPFADIVKKKPKKCHWCKGTDLQSLIKCLNCKKRFFCMGCVKERHFEKQDIKVRCPVCRGACNCRMCSKSPSKTANYKDLYQERRKVDKTQQLQYLIHILLPVLSQINQEHNIELEFEVQKAGKDDSNMVIEQAETSHQNVYCCSKCNISIVDYHRSCSSCFYNLCMSCCRELRLGSLPGGLPNRASHRWVEHDKSLTCPRSDYGGCNGRFLELRSIFPIKWTKDLEVDAKEMLCNFKFSKTPDNSFCSLCKSLQQKAGVVELSQEVAKRVDSCDNFLFSPTLHKLHKQNLHHFQEHWGRGHPVIVRNVFRGTSDLAWDPVVMFCDYLDKTTTDQNRNKATKGTNCLDWCEVEINNKETFMGSLEGKTYANMRRKTIKFNAWLSSHLYQEHFPTHYGETLQALPLQEYMNPTSGLLNLAIKLPGEIAKPELGPCIYISYGGPEELLQAESLTKLCYESCDVVNILAYATDDLISEEQLARIKTLMKKKYSNSTNQKEKRSMPSEDTGESGLHDVSKDEMQLPNGTTKVPCLSRDSLNGQISTVGDNNSSYDSEHESESNSDSIMCSGSIGESENLEDMLIFQENEESSSSPKLVAGAQWDIFRRQDVPKILEYLKTHSNELSSGYCYPKHVDDPILDRSFFLDAFHKLRLKEEYDVQPWSFDQHTGEAIIIPAGCPYQIKKLKSSVSIVLDFISPESAEKCIHLNDEIRLLPLRHKAKDKMLEVRKMTLHGINAAITELRDLMRTELSSRSTALNCDQ
ncbi:hypothetical protein Leryth_025325 [Lithospermum erythrorhizon]|nr:hypothetical protein Leryth_025325 [Lithospermum erythrorhizon]